MSGDSAGPIEPFHVRVSDEDIADLRRRPRDARWSEDSENDDWRARGANLRRWTLMPRGGHHAPAEQPLAVVADIRAFFSELKRDER